MWALWDGITPCAGDGPTSQYAQNMARACAGKLARIFARLLPPSPPWHTRTVRMPALTGEKAPKLVHTLPMLCAPGPAEGPRAAPRSLRLPCPAILCSSSLPESAAAGWK